MSNPFIAIALGCLVGFGVVAPSVAIKYQVDELQAAAKQQCINNDWPEAQHQAHIDWCVKEGYLLPLD